MNPEIIDALIKYHKVKVDTFRFFTDTEGKSIYQLTIIALRELKKHEETAHFTTKSGS